MNVPVTGRLSVNHVQEDHMNVAVTGRLSVNLVQEDVIT